jgi:hypothetical protein
MLLSGIGSLRAGGGFSRCNVRNDKFSVLSDEACGLNLESQTLGSNKA